MRLIFASAFIFVTAITAFAQDAAVSDSVAVETAVDTAATTETATSETAATETATATATPETATPAAETATVETPAADTTSEQTSIAEVAESSDGDGDTDGDDITEETIDVQSPSAPELPKPIRLGGNRLDGIAAVVGSEIILLSEVEAYVHMRLSALGIRPEDADISKTVEMCMEDLIDNKVLLARAKGDTTIHVRSDEVEAMLNNHINMILRQNRMTMEQLEFQLRAQQGTTMARFKTEARRAIREQLYKQKIQQNFFMGASVSRRDVEKFYAEYADSLPEVGESVELRKLSLRVAASDSVRQAAFDKINRVWKLLEGGASFDSLARVYSDGPEAASGGDLGFLAKGSTTEITLEEQAFSLSVGKVSEPFETRLGYHIIMVEEKRDRRVKLRQIMVRHAPTEAERAAIAARLDSIRQSIKTPEAFEAAAREISADLATRPRGGDMGWVGITEMAPAVRTVVQDLENGQISPPVTEDNMISVYMVKDRAETRRLTLENDYAAIAEKARDIMAQKRMLDAVKTWRDKLFIDIRI